MTFNVGLGALRRTSCDPAGELRGAVILEGAHPHHPRCPQTAQNQALSSQGGGPLAYISGCPVNLAFSKFRNWFLVNTSSFHGTLIKAPHSSTYSQHFWVKTLILALYVSPPLE